MKKILLILIVAIITAINAKAQIVGTVDTTRFRPYFFYSQKYIWVNTMPDPVRYKTVYVFDQCGRILLKEPLKGRAHLIPINFATGWYTAIMDTLSIRFFHHN